MSVRHINSQNDLTALIESKRSGLVVIDFWASELDDSVPLASVARMMRGASPEMCTKTIRGQHGASPVIS